MQRQLLIDGHSYSSSFEEFKRQHERKVAEEQRKREKEEINKADLEMLSLDLEEAKFSDEDFF